MVVINAFRRDRDTEAHRSPPSVVVVDPRFDAYRSLAASARSGRIDLHFRSSGAAALKLAGRLPVDAWLIAAELDDMAGCDFVSLLSATRGGAKVAVVDADVVGRRAAIADEEAREAGVDAVLRKPISMTDLEELLDMPAEERGRWLTLDGITRTYVALPVSVGAAVIAIAVLMAG